MAGTKEIESDKTNLVLNLKNEDEAIKDQSVINVKYALNQSKI